MLYDRWREVALARCDEWALREQASGRRWTFGELLKAGDRSEAPAEGWVCPRGNGSEFVFELLRAWRHGRVVCPLEAGEAAPVVALPPKEIAHVKRTSATTGTAKLVCFTEEQLAADPENIVTTMGLRAGWPNIGVISLAHSYGFSNLVLPLLLFGIPLILLEAALPELLRAVLMTGENFTLAGVPTLWRAWFEAGVITENVKLAISAGAALPIGLERDAFEKCGVKIHNFLGASECGGIAYDRGLEPRKDASAVGTVLKNVSLSAVEGKLEVRSAGVAQSYWPERGEGLGEGVFRTSDLVEIRGGVLYMRGRASEVIHIAGRKVAPEEIERVLLKHPSVKECLVFDAPRAGEEHQIVAVVVGEAGVDEMKKFLAERIPAWQAPRQWRLVESLGANERGKVSRARWREEFIRLQKG